MGVNTGAGADPSNSSITNATGAVGRSGVANNERGSVHSASGIIMPTDRGSVRSGLQSNHGRNDSVPGSVGIQVGGSSIPGATGRMSRRSSGWGEIVDSEDNEDEVQNGDSEQPNNHADKPGDTPNPKGGKETN